MVFGQILTAAANPVEADADEVIWDAAPISLSAEDNEFLTDEPAEDQINDLIEEVPEDQTWEQPEEEAITESWFDLFEDPDELIEGPEEEAVYELF